MTRDQLAAWLAQVHGDGELSADAFRLAFTLMQAADATGTVRKSSSAKLATDEHLGRLIARGHLYPIEAKGFRLAVHTEKLRRQTTAHLIPFPSNRRRAFVEKQARTMANMSTEKGEAYLRSQLAIQGDSMRRKGIDETAIARVQRDLQSAIRAELFRRVLLSNPREPA